MNFIISVRSGTEMFSSGSNF